MIIVVVAIEQILYREAGEFPDLLQHGSGVFIIHWINDHDAITCDDEHGNVGSIIGEGVDPILNQPTGRTLKSCPFLSLYQGMSPYQWDDCNQQYGNPHNNKLQNQVHSEAEAILFYTPDISGDKLQRCRVCTACTRICHGNLALKCTVLKAKTFIELFRLKFLYCQTENQKTDSKSCRYNVDLM